ncbi:putative serine/threonine protein phosphatase [Ptychographa xylographoides]|nr:putative serine/threonine protein phosphatase [Ptychographa xylographoides]
MKVTSVLYAALLAFATVDAAAAPAAAPDAEAVHRWCYRVGEPCNKLKRAADAIAEAVAEPVPEAAPVHRWCYRVGEPCNKAKRDALSMAEALAEAHAAAMPAPKASKTFRIPPESYQETKPSSGEIEDYCNGADAPCSKVKRAAEAIAAAMAEPAAQPEPEAEAVHRWCYRVGEPCNKHKRALDDLVAKMAKI